MTTAVDFTQLEPQNVWAHFATLCQIPRPSKQEQQLRQHLQDWAIARGLETYVDTIGNLIIRKAATQGMEHVAGVILQGHIDMVTQANRGTVHDFTKDPIQPILKDGWLIAENTTLGADNGIGVALALAVLDSDDLVHGPIEVLLTVDEEAGMSGARFLEKDVLQGKWLFNIDTEEWGQLYLGCAGSQDIEVIQSLTAVAIKPEYTVVEIQVLGLRGGHSGVSIHLGRGNANLILAQFLQQNLAELGGQLIEFSGGTARNAMAREAVAKIAISPIALDALRQKLTLAEQAEKTRLSGIDDGIVFSLTLLDEVVTQAIDEKQQQAWLNAVADCPYGVAKMSDTLPNVVETSNNVGVVRLTPSEGSALLMVRSMVNTELQAHVAKLQAHFAEQGLNSTTTALISGWTPNPESAALKCLQQAYLNSFQINPELKVIHAGLECGIIAEHYPELQMVSFGPDIRGAHAPGERVEVESVAKCWMLLKAALATVN
ncbi:aminoacyl-histidine dipeptidase [Acinetobacter sp. MD2]|uniref:aminoacyl-histidine dipeptidase n=1 Tax=Acinetobacter sp. MD2 TaxID=2600066 RepID=UPI002D1F4550|nr:aminoacyl-histidine dipeptidase [Acinetobacter sp. MD2]MEB3767796.1 aminoacyl-histidine dipeptidase [Acinetobacter sp. MD2]